MQARIRGLSVVAAVAMGTTALNGTAQAHAESEWPTEGPDRSAFSIQEAVDDAAPGDTVWIPPGTYEETITVTTDGLVLRGHDVLIEPPGDAAPTDCDSLFPEEPGGESTASGICVIGTDVEVDEDFEVTVGDPVTGVRIRGLTVVGAPAHGLVAIGTEDLTVRKSSFERNGGHGAASFVAEGTTFWQNSATGNEGAGFYIGDSPESDAEVEDNHSSGNELGFLFRSAGDGSARGNVSEDNCSGIVVLADAPGPATDWDIRHNEVTGNDEVCDGPVEGTSTSGAGIALLGAEDFRVAENVVRGHDSQAPSTAPAVVEGGIVVRGGFVEAGATGTAPRGEVEENRAFDNEPADIVWDGTGDVEFDDNRCEEADPDGVCA